jgi:hypothetical protein
MSHPSYGQAFIDESHGKAGFSYVGGYPGRPGAGRGFSGQAQTPRYSDEDDGDDGDD